MKTIKLIVLDVDGTLTDGRIIFGSDGTEYKNFHVKDGMGISLARKSGIDFAIITGRESSVVTRRAAELGITHIYQGISDKLLQINEILKDKNCTLQETAFIGDDINDLSVINQVGFAACPIDANEEVKRACQYVAAKAGGHGAVRDVIEYILKAQGTWSDIVRRYAEAQQ